MKITIFSDNVAPYRMEWAEGLAKTNEVCFVYTKSHDLERNDDWLVKNSNSVTMVKLPAKIVRNHAITLNVVRYIKRHPSDIVIFDGYGVIPNYLGILYMKTKKIMHYVNVDGVYIHKKENIITSFLKRLIISKYMHILCGSEYSAQHFEKLGVCPENITVHNFSSIHDIDILDRPFQAFEKAALRKKLELDEKPLILAVGRFLKLKRFDMLIEAFSPMDSSFQLLIIGEGEEKRCYEELIREKSLQNVRILEFMPYENLVEYYKAADLFVLPSVTEIWGLVVNEAMSFGLPVITSDDCGVGISMIENNVNGFVFSGGVDELYKHMKTIMFDEELREKIAVNNLKKMHEYTIEHIVEKHLETFCKE